MQVSNGRLKERDHLKYSGVNGRITLQCVIGLVGMNWILVDQVKRWQAIEHGGGALGEKLQGIY